MQKIINNKNGQAIFEFIIFIPFLVFLFSIYYTVGNALNGGINQQKSVRGYFYTLVKGNSHLITANDLKSLSNKGIKRVGFFSIGWREHGDDTKEFAPCFRFSSMIKGNSDEDCDSGQRPEEGSSTFVRVFTAYGVCGPTYLLDDNAISSNGYNYQILQHMQTSRACILSNN